MQEQQKEEEKGKELTNADEAAVRSQIGGVLRSAAVAVQQKWSEQGDSMAQCC